MEVDERSASLAASAAEGDEEDPAAEEPGARGLTAQSGGCELPLARVRKVIKEDRDIHMCQADAVYAIALAAQKFIEDLAESAAQASQEQKRKTVAYKDLVNVVSDNMRLDFVADIIPAAVPMQKALERRKADEGRSGA
ncbi:hypothetical protein IWQ60_007849 [Tieghemiomyces parasiticus]|uniref:Transcription factor CBF/NF-Y/archaeal histone domain-containing protein n=1 Tax=Tieghemiomyces parasiticus TaxID=78921 RepID=A0A9W7ZV46_9FUNG|nr:hypothetical protein IWQ60_007849 [Tieghemiomyces parasiticus]